MRLNFTASRFIFGHKLWNCAHNFFCKPCSQSTFKMRLNFTANSFVLGHINRGIAPRTFSVKLAGGELPECVWFSQQTDSFSDAQIAELRPQHFLYNLHVQNFQNASEFHGKQLRFWTHKLRKCTQNFVYKACKARTSKIRLNITANRFVFGHTNRGIAPRTFSVKRAGRELPECVWISRQTALFLDAQIVELLPQLFL